MFNRTLYLTTVKSYLEGLTTRFVEETSTITTTTPRLTPTPFIKTTTSRRIFSSPQPFNTRPTTTTTTENPLCYPGNVRLHPLIGELFQLRIFCFEHSGSPIAGCQSSITTPSFCFPGSNDKRCPQLPDTFSTRLPTTYLPPHFPDVRVNRIKRQTYSQKKQIIQFSMTFRPYS